jgi:uncharacterized protein (DUF1499 family)
VKGLALFAVFGCLTFLLSGCSAPQKADIGLANGSLRSCPTSPNCVSSVATDATQKVGPFLLQASSVEAWLVVKKTILTLPRTRIVSSTDDYLHAECRSAIFGFVDDLELQLLPERKQIAIRSAARLGYYDFGVNRKRGEELQRQLRVAGAIR